MRWWAHLVVLPCLVVSCGDVERWAPAPGLADDLPPRVLEARIFEEAGGSVVVEVVVDDDGGCGVEGVEVGLYGDAFAIGSLLRSLEPAGGGVWRTRIEADRCGEGGQVAFAQVQVRDRAGNVKDFAKVWQEMRLQATDGLDEILVEPVTLGAARAAPHVLAVRLELPSSDASDAVLVHVDHDSTGCGLGGHVRAKGPDRSVAWFVHVPDLSTARSETWRLESTRCLARGAWTVDELLLQAEGGGGALLIGSPGDTEYLGADAVPVVQFAVEEGSGDGTPLSITSLAVDPGRLTTGWPADVLVDIGTSGCPPLRTLGKLRRLPAGDGVPRSLLFGDDGVARVGACTPPGRWWLDQLFIEDASGVRRRFDLPYLHPEAGFAAFPDVPSASLLLE